MASSQVILVPLNMFIGLREPNVTFCIDISGSMYNTLNTVKEQIIQYLLDQAVLAKLNLNRLFNLIAFSTDVYPWSNGMVLWNTATVNSALDWIRDLESKTGTNTLDALTLAFQDAHTHSVVLVTDDIPDQDPYLVLNQVSQMARGRPVHCIYITTNNREEDRSALEFLQNLATITKGSFKIVSIGQNGAIDRITPIGSVDSSTLNQLSNLTINSLSAIPSSAMATVYQPPIALMNTFIYPRYLNELNVYNYPNFVMNPRVVVTKEGQLPHKAIAWSRFRPIQITSNGTVIGLTSEGGRLLQDDIAYSVDAGSLLLNKTVLARSNQDGCFYKGKVISQILAHRFMIQFGPNNDGLYTECNYQDTAIYDIIHFDDAFAHSIQKGDRVLAKYHDSDKYLPAEVLEGFEKRGSKHQQLGEEKPLVVKFPDGSTQTVINSHDAVWVPDIAYDKIKYELNLPPNLRQYLTDYNEGDPSKNLPEGSLKNATHQSSILMPRLIYDLWPYFVPYCPLYTNVLHPTSLATQLHGLQFSALTASSLGNSGSLAPNYYRQCRSKDPVVDAYAVNRSIVGAKITPEHLYAQVTHQINQHRHLLDSRSRSESRSKDCSRDRSCSRCRSRGATPIHNHVNGCCMTDKLQLSSHNCHCQNNQTTVMMVPHSKRCETHEHAHNHKIDQRHHHHYVDDSLAHQTQETPHNHQAEHSAHGHQDHHHHHHNLLQQHQHHHVHNIDDCPDTKSNKYYDSYLQSIASLYESAKNTGSKSSSGKSVTFGESTDNLEFDQDHPGSGPSSAITDASIIKKKRVISANNLDRFGNPKVSVGFASSKPSFKVTAQSFGSKDSLDGSLVEKSHNNLNDVYKREQSAKQLKFEQERQASETRKQMMIEQANRNNASRIREFEKNRENGHNSRKMSILLAKKEIKADLNKRIEQSKVNQEEKDNKKYEYLRGQAISRNLSLQETRQNEEIKEKNKIIYKKNESEKRNQDYHNRLLMESAVRKQQQQSAQSKLSNFKRNEEKREMKERMRNNISNSISTDGLIKTNANMIYY